MFPMTAHYLAKLIGDEHMIVSGLLLGLLLSYLNTLAIYRVGRMMYGDSRLGELAAYLYIASHCTLY